MQQCNIQMLNMKGVIVSLLLLHLCSGAKLPGFIKLCKKNDANLGKCVQDSANLALPHLIKGVEELRLPPLTNLTLPKIHAPNYLPYDFTFEGNITDLEGVSYYDSEFDIKSLVFRGKFRFPKLELKGKYKIHGFVGKIPITGKGPANITLHNVTLEIITTSALFKINETEYFKVVSAALVSYNISSFSYKLDKLFHGDKVQGATANQLVNNYWWILAGNFVPHVPVYLVEVFYRVAGTVFSNVTMEDIFSSS